jgi:uncharacterized protein with gpF-like domain
MTAEQLGSNIEDIILTAVEDFNEGLESSQVNAYNKLLGAVKELSLDSRGNIKKTAANVKVLRNISKAIEDTLLTDTYKKRVGKYLKSFDAVEAQQILYFNVIKEGFKANPMLEAIKTQSIDNTIAALTESGLNQAFTQPVKDILIQNITTGGSYSTMTEQLREFVIGNEEIDGAFLRHTKAITTDAVKSYNATYNQSVSQDLGLQFYRYVGGIKDTTREFCEERNKKFFHIEEIKAWGRGEKCCGLSFPVKKNGAPYWDGMKKGTNENNILINRGGWMCNHQYVAVSQGVVPEDVVKRAKEAGYL